LSLSEGLSVVVASRLAVGGDAAVALLLARGAQLEDALDECQLRRRRCETTEGGPVVDDKSRTNGRITTVDRAGNARHLHERRNLVHILDRRLRVNKNALVARDGVRANERVLSDASAEGLHAEHITDDFLGFAGDVGVDEGDVVVAADAVSEGRETLLDALDLDGVGQRVSNVLQFLVGGDGGQEQAVLVAGDEAADGAGLADGDVDDGNVVGELLLEDGVEVLRRAEGTEAVGVGELGEDTNVVGGFEASTESHFSDLIFFFLR
jgi:hypothetical protein